MTMRAEYDARRRLIVDGLNRLGLTCFEPEGAFYVFVDIRKFGLSSDEFCTRMIREAGVATVPGSCFGAEGYLRISYCYSDAELEEGLNRLETFIRSLPLG